MTDCPPSPSRRLRAYAAVAKGALWLLLAAWLVLALAWGALHAFIVPRIGELRPELELRASRVLGIPVHIGRIEVLSEGFAPLFQLSDVVLLDPAGRPALTLPRVLAAVSPRSLLALGFEQLYIDGPQLDIRRDKSGRLFVAGLDLSRGGEGDPHAADWFFSQPEFVIRNGTVRWTDDLRGVPPLSLGQVDFVVRNGRRSHDLRLDATPPKEWGDPEHALRERQFFDVLEACVQHLPGLQARVFMMREWLELETDEICKELTITSTNLWVLLHRARLRLRECLQSSWFDAHPAPTTSR